MMAGMEKVITFVKDVLGCGCSDDVFEYIKVDEGVHLDDRITLSHKLNIGNKLLVYIYHPVSIDEARNNLQRIFNIGIEERDEKGFNRIRVVVASDDTNTKQAAYLASKKMKLPDDRVHLHIMDAKKINIK
jgi:hypothetical protein